MHKLKCICWFDFVGLMCVFQVSLSNIIDKFFHRETAGGL